MNNINRKVQPEYKTIDTINIKKSYKKILNNNIPIHIINSGSQDIIKIDFVFDAGVYFQDKKIQASLTNSMLNEGTTNNNTNQIAENFDFYGAFLELYTSHKEACISLYTLNKYINKTLPLVIDILNNSNFPEKEFKTIINKKKQNFLISLEKTAILVKDKFNEVVYGENHDDFENINTNDLKEFFEKHYTTNNCHIIASGKIDESIIEYINNTISDNWIKKAEKTEKTEKKHTIIKNPEKKHTIIKKDAIQAAIRVGRELFNKNHPDYIGMQLLNSVLGGYFGSRLMQNIREDKAYTYGISSFILSHKDTGHWTITTEVDVKFCDDTISEIYKEIERLQTELIPEKELNIVKNYISGELIRDLDNPFSLAESLKNNLVFDKDNSYYSYFLNETKNISAETIQKLAIKYLQKEDLFLVISTNK